MQAEHLGRNRLHVWLACAVGLALAALVFVPTFVAFPAAQGSLQLRVLSNPRGDMVSGGDALVQVDVPAGVAARDVRVTVNKADVSAAFRGDASGRALTGLITGLTNGPNTVAVAAGGHSGATLTVVNHPIAGPVFAGPHETPFICQTQDFKLPSGATLGSPLDANCSIATRVDYFYRASKGGGLKALADPKAPPPDVATVTTTTGQTARYIVRLETGTINRAIYQIAMLHDPSREGAPTITTRPAGWNGRLIYTFGGGCTGGWYRQGTSTGGVDDDVMLQRGYAVASATLNTFGNNCAEVLAAETMMMVKEHFIETYGAPKFTIGWGASGGSYQQHHIANGYPGLLDGIIPRRSFPDVGFGTVPYITDARLLKRYFDRLATVAYTDEQKRQITGFGTLATMAAVDEGAGRINATEHCPATLPQALRYDAANNPTGARCTVYDHAVNVYGRDPKTGFARRALDNVGIQYGLAALNSGTMNKSQFLELNEKIGGFDQDGNIVAARTVADPEAMRAAYRSGLMNTAGGGLATTPIIDYRGYLDDHPEGDVHVRYHSFSMRERLIKANGHADNHVMLTDDRKWGDSLRAPALRDALSQMDAWLSALADDHSNDAQIAKVRRARPADLVDACWTRDDRPQKIVEKATYGAGRCESLYPANSFPRGVAGSALASDVIKCQLKPITASEYKVTFTSDELTRLRHIFPGGVCDWSKPGVEQQPALGSWQTFNAPPGATIAARQE
jgi:hypothetical protein